MSWSGDTGGWKQVTADAARLAELKAVVERRRGEKPEDFFTPEALADWRRLTQQPPEPAAAKPEDQNHVLPANEDWIPSGSKAKVRANLDAIQLVKKLETENRNATPEEKQVLARYTGWGGLKEVFDEGKAAYRERPGRTDEQRTEAANWEKNWGKLYDEVKNTLTPEEHAAAAKSILNAHYTSREVINPVWQAVRRLGFKGGKALESSAGIGNFIGLTPAELRDKTQWNAVELDKISARILAKLYPQAAVRQAAFQHVQFSPNSQDLFIGNVPFAKEGPIDERYPKLSLHNYFLVRGMDLLKPGGLMAVITSDSTMDSPSSRKARELLSEKADLVGAIRLPNTAFKKNAGTEVTTDVLFFRKRDATPFSGGQAFTRTEGIKTYKGEPAEVNEYFAKHPDMMLGRMSLEGTQYGRGEQQALLPTPGKELPDQLQEAIGKLPADVFGAQRSPEQATAPVRMAAAGAKLGQLVLQEGKVAQVQPDGTLETPEWAHNPKAVAQAKRYLELRDATKGHIDLMLDPNATDADVNVSRVKLNKLYDDYLKRHGPMNGRSSAFLDDDVEFPLALALEDADTRLVDTPKGPKRVTEWKKSKLFQERTIFPRVPPERVDTIEDALQVSLNFQNRVDPDYIAKLTGQAADQVKQYLSEKGLAFEDPDSGQWENPSKYLSGFVKRKLQAARLAAADDPRYQPNVAALEKVQPKPIAIENIGVRLGSTWVPPQVIKAFLRARLGVDAQVDFTPQTGTWHVKASAGQWSDRNKTTFGIHGWAGHELVEKALNLQSPIVTKTEPYINSEGKQDTHEVKDPAKSAEAAEKQDRLQKEFKDWVRSSPEVARELEGIYNDKFNGVVAPKFEAPTWTHYPGASQDITLRDHQKQVVTRMLQNSTLLAHAVGTGKTFAMVTAAMEMRRLGLAKKPMIVVQNATLEQFARSFKRLYPTARILAPNAKARDAENRNTTMSRIATGDWDAVIVPQSFVNMLPDDPERETAYITDRLKELEEAKIEANLQAGKRSPKASDLQRAIDRLQERLDALKNRKKDNVRTFEQLGVDALFVDEAHAYKKLEFTTKMDNVKGLDTGASQRGLSMFFKARWVQEHNQGRNVVFATGTPVSNTIAEAWNMMRYVRPDVLKAYGIEDFDSFASTFGDTLTQLEMTAGGGWKVVTRFARYVNGPELIAAWRTAADVVTPEEVNLPGLPALKNGKVTTVTIKQTERLKKYVEHLREMLDQFDKMSGKQKRENSHIPLVVFGLAKKATLEMRMINPDLPDEPGSKLNEAADRIAQIYHDASVKGAQMVFSDAYQDNPKKPRFNLYQELKKKLAERGIPEGEIAIITDDIKDAKREALFKKLNDGDLRVAIGSTERMGVGVNAQEHLFALHHLDAPARPMDIEQRNGRMIRQGNINPEVEVLQYGVENTLDAAMYQKLATKQKFINQILRGDITGRNFEDAANEQSLSFEEQMAAFSGDRRAMEKVALDNQVRQLESLRSGHFEQVRQARERIEELTQKGIPWAQRNLEEAKKTAALFSKAFPAGGDYTLQASGQNITGKKEITQFLDEGFERGLKQGIANAAQATGTSGGGFGTYFANAGDFLLNGQRAELELNVPRDWKTGAPQVEHASVGWKFTGHGYSHAVKSGQGFFHSLQSELERLTVHEPRTAEENLAASQRDLREMSGFVQQPFGREAELDQAKQRLTALEAELSAPAPTVTHSMSGSTTVQTPGQPGRRPIATLRAGPAQPPNALVQDLQRARALTAPQTAGGDARFAANLLRMLNARMANEMARADEALKAYRRDFDRTPVPKNWEYDPTLPLPRNLAFIDAYEGGDLSTLSPIEREAAAEFQRQNDEWIDRVHALGTGALQTLVENYFPHIWDNPARARQVVAQLLARRPLQGPRSFLKQRTYELFREGLAAGLRPVHDNPVDLWLLKKREVERFILGHSFGQEMKKAGLFKFVHAFSKAPDGWSTVNDRAFQVYGPPTVTIKEAFDAGMRAKTLDVLAQLGVPHERLVKIGGQRWGYEVDQPGHPGTERIVSKFGGPDFVLWHELGHALDNRYPDMRQKLFGTDQLQAELRALADLRFEGETPSPNFKRNVRSSTEKMAVVLQAYLHAPERMRQVAPTVYATFKDFLASHPELSGIDEIRPGLRLGVEETEMPVGGLVKLGNYYMPDAAARVVNNYLSPGLNSHLWYRSLREVSNFMNGVQLGMSAFHLGFTSVDAAVSRLAAGIEDLSRGDLVRAMRTIISVPVAPVTNIIQGARMRAEALRPGTQGPLIAEWVRALEAAGGRIGQDRFWRTEFTRRMIRALHEGSVTGYIKGVLNLPFAVFEQAARPIMEFVVPLQKLGVFADLAKRDILRLGPNATAADLREALRKAWDSVDNRMGQVVYDNLFYNRTVKDLALLSFRAYGWQFGKYRELGGGTGDIGAQLKAIGQGKRPEMTHRMAYMLALPLLLGVMGALAQWLMTREKPRDWRDYYMPRTGEVGPDGHELRINFPSYMKDVIAMSKHPVTSVGHALNPAIAAAADMLQNRDYYDTRIFNADDPLPRRIEDLGLFMGKQFVPFSVSGAMKMRDDAAPLQKQILPFFGVVPTPRRLTMTPAEELASEAMAEQMPKMPRTKEQFDRGQLIKEIVAGLKTGNTNQAYAKYRDGMAAGTLNADSERVMIERMNYSPLQFQVQHLDSESSMRVWRVANEGERQQILPIIGAKVTNSKVLPPEKKAQFLRELAGVSELHQN